MRYRLRTLMPSNRWLRFSLRTLFLLTLLVAVGLGVQMKRLRDRKVAVYAIESAGGTMGISYLGPEWLQNLINDDKCFWDPIGVTLGPHARQAGQEEPKLDDALLARLLPVLKQFNHLEALDISRTTITDRSAKLLATFDTLTRLRLSQTQVSDEAIRHISRLHQLNSLDLYSTAITDECVSDLCQLGNLAYLDIRETGITSVGLSQLHADLPRCKIVN